ncbi:hypothetical protein VF21_05130 [Pseudogymnoascus sp. 05NY08]|nr:hypothetical protein VF21_05130 [Pseudogymnoascus sp. 05NY08]
MAGLEDYAFAYNATLNTSPMNHSTYDEYSNDPRFIESQRQFRALLFDTAHSTGPTRVGSPVAGGDKGSDYLHPSDSNASTRECGSYIGTVVSTGERVMWLKNYINEVAPWLDMFDAQQAFGRKVPMLAKTSAPLTYAMLAISAPLPRGNQIVDATASSTRPKHFGCMRDTLLFGDDVCRAKDLEEAFGWMCGSV